MVIVSQKGKDSPVYMVDKNNKIVQFADMDEAKKVFKDEADNFWFIEATKEQLEPLLQLRGEKPVTDNIVCWHCSKYCCNGTAEFVVGLTAEDLKDKVIKRRAVQPNPEKHPDVWMFEGRQLDPSLSIYQCKCLKNGKCSIYEHRPAICKKYMCAKIVNNLMLKIDMWHPPFPAQKNRKKII